jgi:uncharacterized protein (DUF2384 family)
MVQKNIACSDTPISVWDTEIGASEVSKIIASIDNGGVVKIL